MNATETIDHYLLQLGNDLKLGELRLNADGVCALEASDGATLIIELPPGGSILHLHSPILPMPVPTPPALLFKLLHLNRFGLETRGAAFAIDEPGNNFILCYSRPVEGLEYSVFVNLLGNFLETIRHWRTSLSQEDFTKAKVPGAPEDTGSGTPSPEDQGPPTDLPQDSSYFLRA